MNRGTRIARLAALLVLVLPGIVLATTPGVRARAWAPLVRMFAGKGPEAPRLAVMRIAESLSTIRSLLYGLSADEPTRAFFLSVLEHLEAFDLEALYETLPEEEGAGWRRVRFTGHSESGKYAIRKAEPGEACACDPDGALGSHFGDLAVAFRSRKAQEESSDNFIASARAGIGLGGVSWSQVVGALAEAIRLAESTAPGAPRVEAEDRKSVV